jgi:GDPmannose 4,6-dehydratase
MKCMALCAAWRSRKPKGRLGRVHHILDKLHLHAASLDSYPSICQVLKQCDFTECYHLAAQSFVAENFEDGLSTLNLRQSSGSSP